MSVTWGTNVYEELKKEGRNAVWLSRRTGIKYRRLHRILSGDISPKLEEAVIIADVMDSHPLDFHPKKQNE